ncbi:uroporphyrinogen-III synthase [Sulfurimonas sp.]|uniref:uroporphyrinogen-III synthase n=1 Tax=Sulfurimonas sp. TaxID=2022749 RepID=UPI003569E7C9
MNIQKIIDPLNLIYYEYNKKTETLFYDTNYANRFIELEFFKITYYLTKQNIQFRVLKDKSIEFSKKSFLLKKKFQKLLKYIENKKQNIYLLNNNKVKFAKNIPLFDIKYIKQDINFSNYDALIFSSKNGVLAVDSISEDWRKIPSYAISEQTAKLIKDFDAKLVFSGKQKHGDEFAYEILPELKGKKVLYLRAREIVSDFINILNSNGVKCEDIIVYENNFIEQTEKTLPKNSKIIFSSPSTVKYFFKVFSWNDSYTAISIGNTTAKYFPKNVKPIIADKTSLKACVDKALEVE